MQKIFVYDAGAAGCYGVREDPEAAAMKLGEILAQAPPGTHGTVRRAYPDLCGGPYRYGPVLARAWRDETTGEVHCEWASAAAPLTEVTPTRTGP